MPDPVRVLVVEDEANIRELVCLHLRHEGYECDPQADGRAALERAQSESFDLVVLDLMLPGLDGLSLCRAIRNGRVNQDVPILMLTARREESDKVVGLESGADDYLTKPFLVEELVLRVRGILRRSEWARTPAPTGPTVKVGTHEVDMNTMRATTIDGTVPLTEREVMLVRFFAENEGRVLTRGELLERVWGYSFDTSTRTLDTFIHRLRKHFEEDPRQPLHFHTVRGVGYRFTSDPEE